MDSSDGGPLRLFNFGGAHAAGMLAMTALADFYDKHAAGRRMQNPGWAKQASVRFPERDSALIKRGYRRSSAVSSFVAGSRPKTSLRGLRHPRIGRNAKAFFPFQNVSTHEIAIVIGPTGRR